MSDAVDNRAPVGWSQLTVTGQVGSMTFPADAEDRFRRLYAEAYPDVLRFVQRRTDPDQAEDVAAEAFVVVAPDA